MKLSGVAMKPSDVAMEMTDVAIVGGGPAGLMLAIELGCRGVNCVVLEEDVAEPDFPKANATSSRTMEHYRRRGFANESASWAWRRTIRRTSSIAPCWRAGN